MLEISFTNGLNKNVASQKLINAIDEQEELLKYFSSHTSVIDYIENTRGTSKDLFEYICEKTKYTEEARKHAQPEYICSQHLYFAAIMEKIIRIQEAIEFSYDYKPCVHHYNNVSKFISKMSDNPSYDPNTKLHDLINQMDVLIHLHTYIHYREHHLNWSTACNLSSSGYKDIFGTHENVRYKYNPDICIEFENNNKMFSDLNINLATCLLYVQAKDKLFNYAKEFFTKYKPIILINNKSYNCLENTIIDSIHATLDFVNTNLVMDNIKRISTAATFMCHEIIDDILKFNKEHGLLSEINEETFVDDLEPGIVNYMINAKRNTIESVASWCQENILNMDDELNEYMNSIYQSSTMHP